MGPRSACDVLFLCSIATPFQLKFISNERMTLVFLDGVPWVNVPEGGMTLIKIMSINTGAGVVSYHPDGVEIATVHGLIPMCDDSCFSAGDGVCDERRAVREPN